MPPLQPPSIECIGRFRTDLQALVFDPRTLGVAVSGGPDSLALLLLAAAAYPSQVEAATVDHGLREASADEARMVARHCAALGVPHETLMVTVVERGDGLQAAAREVRYTALGEWMARRDLPVLLTGHHLDDQAETLLMRLMRGSAVAGLAGIRASRPLPGGGTLLRPLLGWRRGELAEIVAAAELEAVQDPANTDERFDRARLRRRLAETPWLDPPALARSAAALADAADALAWMTDDLFVARVVHTSGALTLDPTGLPLELRRRLIGRCVAALASDANSRGNQISRLLGSLEAGETVTIAGIKCVGGDTFRFEQAPPRRP